MGHSQSPFSLTSELLWGYQVVGLPHELILDGTSCLEDLLTITEARYGGRWWWLTDNGHSIEEDSPLALILPPGTPSGHTDDFVAVRREERQRCRAQCPRQEAPQVPTAGLARCVQQLWPLGKSSCGLRRAGCSCSSLYTCRDALAWASSKSPESAGAYDA